MVHESGDDDFISSLSGEHSLFVKLPSLFLSLFLTHSHYLYCVSAEASAEQLDFVLQMVENDKDFYIR